MFPPEIVPPTFFWEDAHPAADCWSLKVEFAPARNAGGQPPETLHCLVDSRQWTPSDTQWETIKRQSVQQPATLTVAGFDRSAKNQVLTGASVRIVTSRDEVGAPIFYREVNLPFGDALRDPANLIRWRFGPISSKTQPPVVLQKMPMCGNCHSFAANGRLMGMDVDYANDKGSYTICAVGPEMVFTQENTITWSDYRREDRKETFGLLSQISPDGRYVVSTVKDLSVFLALDDNLAFSQLFFPVQGILCYYDLHNKTFHALPGADDPRYVQSNPAWSPDGQEIVFARSEAYEVPADRVHGLGLTVPEEVHDFVSGAKKFRYDLYRLPFNGGRGGQAEPVRGASGNGKSNYFAKFSPDGKWIVFCQADSFMLLRPDSQLHIIPAAGGEPRRLECNTARMNSWHSWSPNSKWLVFSSKAFTPYTQLMLSHIDDQGHATPPVILSHFTAANMAANIPEFVNADADGIKQIAFDKTYFADTVHVIAGDTHANQGDLDSAIQEYQKALQANPKNVYAYRACSLALTERGRLSEAEQLLRTAQGIAPHDEYVSCQYAELLGLLGKSQESERLYRHAIAASETYSPPYFGLAKLLAEQGRTEEACSVLQSLIRVKPDDPQPHILLGNALRDLRETSRAIAEYRVALEKDARGVAAMLRLAQALLESARGNSPAVAEAVQLAASACDLTDYRRGDALVILSDAHAAAGNLDEAVRVAGLAIQIADQLGDKEKAELIRHRLRSYGKQ